MPIDSDTVPCDFMLLRTTTTINNNNRQKRQEQRGATKTGERRNENSKIIMIGETEGKKIRFLLTAKILGLYKMVCCIVILSKKFSVALFGFTRRV